MKKTLTILIAAITLTSCGAIKKIGRNMNSNYVHKAGIQAKKIDANNQLTIK